MSCVRVKNVFLSYRNGEKKETVLNGICLNVDAGTVYTLIGASGCGKTSLISCLMGVQTAQSGELTVFGQESSKCSKLIGYMPQSTSLVDSLTIGETLRYFGSLYEMDQKIFDERFDMIVKLLDLPSQHRRIRDLSGGQQRRVSLAVTIIHNPRLLILDEPTVGLDFLLRERIWAFLVEQTAQTGVTAIITTHYISEASNAHRCGFMRRGVLIAEDEPRAILEKLGVESLDEAFYELCMEENVGDCGYTKNFGVDSREREQMVDDGRDRRILRPKVMKGLLVKEFHRVRRQPMRVDLI